MPTVVRGYWAAPGLLVDGEGKQYQSRHRSAIPSHREDVQLALKQMAVTCSHPNHRKRLNTDLSRGGQPPRSLLHVARREKTQTLGDVV
jgi:hypothetical protein